ncbi:GmrSD restriction endonuclease domain-containing protein [Corynebacterium mayonis]|uniref:GmrSD restriction endonuclease domain-containing protein n=1 Tax=Corynebacterium mayonis TaxID=3062461 RepID=UPI003140B9E1
MRYYLALLTVLTIAFSPFPTGLSRSIPAADHAPPLRVTVTGYDREAFGPGWAHLSEGCTTRTFVMAKAFAATECSTAYPDWPVDSISDPYTGEQIAPTDVEVDHLVPLSAAWDMGAHAWPRKRREAFANDPRNLIVVAAAVNREKSDQLPSEWMPSNWRARCAYARQLTAVAYAYDLVLPQPDLRAAKRACAGTAGILGREHLAPVRVPETGKLSGVP